MRRPERIPLVLNAIGLAWMLLPDFRLVQLCEAVGGTFFLEDAELVRRLRDDLDQLIPSPPYGPTPEVLGSTIATLNELVLELDRLEEP